MDDEGDHHRFRFGSRICNECFSSYMFCSAAYEDHFSTRRTSALTNFVCHHPASKPTVIQSQSLD